VRLGHDREHLEVVVSESIAAPGAAIDQTV
jgi:hypothetical protein